MRILYINAVYGIGSTGRSIKELREYCIKHGDDVYVASCTKVNDKNFYRIGNVLDYKLHAFLSRLFNKQASFSTHSTKKLFKLIETVKPDIIQINNVHSNYINFYKFLEYTAKKNMAVILVLDDCWFYTGNCCHYTLAKCYKWKDSCGHCPQLKNWNKSFFYDASKNNLLRKKKLYNANNKLGVIGVSKWITNEAKTSILSSAVEIKNIYNSFDNRIFHPISSNLNKNDFNNKKIILGVANYWDNSKGLDKFNVLAEMLDDSCYQIVLVGNGDSNIINKKIKNIPKIDDLDKLVYIYNVADVFVQMSAEESFGKVCVEAMACGTPIVVLNSTASPELVGYRCGSVVMNENIEEIREKIIEICARGKDYYSEYCINYVNEMFNKEKNLNSYREFYKFIYKEE